MIPPKIPITHEDFRHMLQSVERSIGDRRSEEEIAVALGILPVSQAALAKGDTEAQKPHILPATTPPRPTSSGHRFDVC